MGNWLNKLFRIDKKHLERIKKDAENVLALEEEIAKLSDIDLQLHKLQILYYPKSFLLLIVF